MSAPICIECRWFRESPVAPDGAPKCANPKVRKDVRTVDLVTGKEEIETTGLQYCANARLSRWSGLNPFGQCGPRGRFFEPAA